MEFAQDKFRYMIEDCILGIPGCAFDGVNPSSGLKYLASTINVRTIV